VLLTTDGGAAWKRSFTGTGANLVAVDFIDARHGWAVGSTPLLVPVVAATSDGGRTWTTQPLLASVGTGLLDVSFLDSLRGMVVGYAGSAFRTTDGGRTWLPMVVGVGRDPTTVDSFHSVHVVSETVAVVGSFQGFVYRTDNGGLTWATRGTLHRTVFGLAAAGEKLFAAGAQGMVARSEDGGATWGLEVSGTNEDLLGVSATGVGSAWAVGIGGSAVRFTSRRVPITPLNVSERNQWCRDGAGIRWVHRAAGAAVDADAGDVVGDRRPEIVLAGPEGLRVVRPFQPTGRATVWALRFQTKFQQVRLAELDGDRGREIVAASANTKQSREGVVAVEGESGRVRWSRAIPAGIRTFQLTDLDGDHRSDIVALGEDQAVHLLSGRDGRDLRSPIPLGQYGGDLRVGDLTGAGRPAAVVTLRDGRALAFDLTSGRELWRYQVRGDPADLRAAALADMTGDGATDVVVAGIGHPAALTGVLTGVLNTGAVVAALDGRTGKRMWDYGDLSPSQANAVGLRDLTDDGVPDVVAQISRFEGSHTVALDGRGRVIGGMATGEPVVLWDADTAAGTGLEVAYRPEELVLADGTGDGRPEVYEALLGGRFVAISGTPRSGSPSVPLAPGAPVLWETTRQLPGYHVSWVRIDGEPYVLTLSGDHLVALRRPDTGAVAWAFDAGGSPAIAVGEMDGDGRADVAVGNRSGRAYALTGSGSNMNPRDMFSSFGMASMVVAEVGGGGAREMIGGAADGTVRAVDPRTARVAWERALGSGVAAMATGAGVVAVGRQDGGVDGLHPANGRVLWSRPSPSRQAPSPVMAASFLPASGTFAVGDASGTIRILSATSGEVTKTITIGAGSTGGIHALAAADLSGDGRAEIVAGAGSTFYAFTSDGTRLWSFRSGSFATSVAPADVDEDGRDDVVGLSWDGQAYGLDGRDGTVLWSVRNGQPAGAAEVRPTAQARPRALVATAFDDGFVGIRVIGPNGEVEGSCRLRKTPFAVLPIPGSGGVVDAVVSTNEGDVYRIAA
jgi:outer membrane protein assembly factor BamB